MNAKPKCWQVRDKGQLLLALMKELEGNAHISIEGDLRALRLATYPGASTEPTDILKPITFGTAVGDVPGRINGTHRYSETNHVRH
jgi:hypothetical protein